MAINPVSSVSQKGYTNNVSFEKKEKSSNSGNASFPERKGINRAQAMAIAAMMLPMSPAGAISGDKGFDVFDTAPIENTIGTAEVSQQKAADKVIIEKTLNTPVHGRVVVKAVNREGDGDKFNKVLIKLGMNEEGVFTGFRGEFQDQIRIGRVSEDYKLYKTDPKLEAYLNELMKSDKRGDWEVKIHGTVADDEVNIASVPEYAHYQEMASRQFTDNDGNVFLVNLYCTDGEPVHKTGIEVGNKRFDKAIIFIMKDGKASMTEVTDVYSKSYEIKVARADGKKIALWHKEMSDYLKAVQPYGKEDKELEKELERKSPLSILEVKAFVRHYNAY